MKQFYDVSALLDVFTDFQQIGPTYGKIAQAEIACIYAENYTPETAAESAAKIMYMSVCLLSNTEYLRVKDYMEFLDVKVEQGRLAPIRYLRKANPEAYAYAVKTDRLLPALQS